MLLGAEMAVAAATAVAAEVVLLLHPLRLLLLLPLRLLLLLPGRALLF